MEITVTAGDIGWFEADAIIVNILEGMEDLSGDLSAIDGALDGGECQDPGRDAGICHS